MQKYTFFCIDKNNGAKNLFFYKGRCLWNRRTVLQKLKLWLNMLIKQENLKDL